MKLLVVDDHRPVGEIISRIARQSGWEASLSVTVDRLEETVRTEGVNALVLDYALDGDPKSPHNGLTIIAGLREQGLKLPVILFSGWPDMVDRKLAAELGVLRVLEKPLSIQELRQCLVEAKKHCLSNGA
jgi:DNA-binding response OmpR family regulator